METVSPPGSIWRSEALALWALVLPIVVQMGSQQFMVATDLLFLGHLGRSELAVGSLCTTIFNLLWFGVAGFGTGFDTLGSQAQGAADFAAVRQWAFLAAAFLTACCVPAAIVLSCGESIARTILSQDEYTSERVGRFCTLLIVGLFAAAWTLVMQKFLQVRGVVKPVAWTSFATFLLNIALNVLFIRIMNLGLNGSALATTTSRVVNLILVAAYLRFSDQWSAGALTEVWRTTTPCMCKRMFELGSRGAVMVAAEASSFDVTVVFASQISQVAMNAHMAMLNITGLTFMTGPMAFGIAANVRVGNLLGAGSGFRAKVASRVSVALGVTWMACMAALILIFRRQTGEVFVGDKDNEMVMLAAKIAPIAAVFQVFDGLLGTSNGVLRACGRQALLAWMNIIALWLVGVLSGYVITFLLKAGVIGLWYGLALGVTVGGVVLFLIVTRLDWDVEVASAAAAALTHGIGGSSASLASVRYEVLEEDSDSPSSTGSGEVEMIGELRRKDNARKSRDAMRAT
ncbi:Multidrug/Oligosaccharidyl-lipid/Polysaccharide flippase [Micromonas commoda]|uniref:Protein DETOXIFICATION n=1 Tax=Micromonas commoda (strain RCC299 / NOUM17 / CCMP2709) TaxID=296587 RepID=C1E6I3_MICCC|nr:Multidrug/Oligosaccharidyl-lipid/Polysaccharide flippase [Micromonas commoda]ACO63435.1 Multidrug/Oligosaccharidyl-lipid/Polysaccharide flippase [Micromonas commoda]|eukprot:XP_002502177.1 Multidrug/Oligosaccharidyl-lipid/Polysaccharide flippase [Micromonas commoda]